ncbi:MAG: LysM peptidoglycan-binding domain-containing protein [Cytophagaceae bacterium]|nr:LysM peptidoglycan-binding domain-containing protein [Cytophagaceae bacterium]
MKLKICTGILIFICLNSFAGIKDSVGIEKKDGKTFILHKIEAKETLYSLAKRYKVSVDEIKAANPELTADLKIGQSIFIPYKSSKTHTVAAKETLYSISKKYGVSVDAIKAANPDASKGELSIGQVLTIPGAETVVTDNNTKPLPATHTVEAKETWYSISKKYGMKAEDLQKINPGVGDLKVGQVINISGENKTVNSTTVIDDPSKNTVEKPVEVTKPAKVVTVKPENNLPVVSNLKKDAYTKVNESGFVELYTIETEFHYALHKTAPVGTIIYLENPESGQKVYVRVMGKLTDAPSGVIMRISKKAFDKLSKGEPKVKVSASYIP